MFTQISINCIATNNWLDSALSVYTPPDGMGFVSPPATLMLTDITDPDRLAMIETVVGALIAQTGELGCIATAITILPITDHVEADADGNETLRRKQYSITITSSKPSGASGTITQTTEQMPESARDAFISFLNVY